MDVNCEKMSALAAGSRASMRASSSRTASILVCAAAPLSTDVVDNNDVAR